MMLHSVANELGIAGKGLPDNVLWAKIEAHPQFEAKREEILDRLRGAIDSFEVPNQNEFNFMDELEKL